jgi:hypothetical protein
MNSDAEMKSTMPSIFLSHSGKDKPFARKIAEDFRKAGLKVWLDESEILVGDSISQKLQKGLEESDLVAVLLTKHSVSSGWVEKEWQSKIGIEAQERRVVILPLKGDECEIPPLLLDKKYADLTDDYQSAIKHVVKSVRAHKALREGGEKPQLDKLIKSLEQKKARRRTLETKLTKLEPEDSVVVNGTSKFPRIEHDIKELNDAIADLERKLEILESDTQLPSPTVASQSSSSLSFVSEGGRYALFFSIINPSSGVPLRLSSFSFVVSGFSLICGGEDRFNLAELTAGLGHRKRRLASANISTGETFILAPKVVRIDPGDVVPFSLPLCCDWRDDAIKCRLLVRLLGPDGEIVLPSDSVYLLEKPHKYSRRLLVVRSVPIERILRGKLTTHEYFGRFWHIDLGDSKLAIPDYLVHIPQGQYGDRQC